MSQSQFPSFSRFNDTEVRHNINAMRGAKIAKEDESEEPVARIPLSQVEDWYRTLDRISMALERRTPRTSSTEIEEIDELRDAVYSHLRG